MEQDNGNGRYQDAEDAQFVAETVQHSDDEDTVQNTSAIVAQTQPDMNAELHTMLESMQRVVEEMRSLRQDFDTKVKYDESKERQIDILHRELQGYREGLHFKILRPLFIDLIAVHDDLGKLIETMPREDANVAQTRMADNLTSFQYTIEEILRRNGVDVYTIEDTMYIPGKQRALQVVETADAAQDKQVARHIRQGFEYEGKILRPELVAVYKVAAKK